MKTSCTGPLVTNVTLVLKKEVKAMTIVTAIRKTKRQFVRLAKQQLCTLFS